MDFNKGDLKESRDGCEGDRDRAGGAAVPRRSAVPVLADSRSLSITPIKHVSNTFLLTQLDDYRQSLRLAVELSVVLASLKWIYGLYLNQRQMHSELRWVPV